MNATKDKVFWENLEREIQQTRKNGGKVGEVLARAGVKRHLYDAARARFGWVKKKTAKVKKHSKFIELAPVGTGQITVERNGIKILVPNADLLPQVIRALEAL